MVTVMHLASLLVYGDAMPLPSLGSFSCLTCAIDGVPRPRPGPGQTPKAKPIAYANKTHTDAHAHRDSVPDLKAITSLGRYFPISKNRLKFDHL